MKCSICKGEIEHKKDSETGKVYWSRGNNAEPVRAGRCCNTCNATKVIAARLALLRGE